MSFVLCSLNVNKVSRFFCRSLIRSARKTLRRSYRLANFFGIIVVFDHAVNIISQFAVILDVLNAARMYFVTHAFGWTMLTLEHISQTLIFVVL